MGELHNPHDKIFKQIEKDPAIARDLIQGLCPEDVLACLDLSTLENDNNSYIDETLNEYYSDLVFNCKSSNPGELKIAILLEHKSYKPENEFLQLLRYMLSIWEAQFKQGEPLRPVVPLILYHGETPWKAGRFKDKLSSLDPALKPYFPDFSYIIADLGNYTEEEIKNRIFSNSANKILALLFKNFKKQAYLEENMVQLFTLVKEYMNDSGKDVFISMFLYFISIVDVDEKELVEKIGKISQEGGEIAMNTYTRVLNRGIEQGEARGEAKGVAWVAKNLLKTGIPLDIIEKTTGLSAEQIKRL